MGAMNMDTYLRTGHFYWKSGNFNALLDKAGMTVKSLIERTRKLYTLKEENMLAFSLRQSLPPTESLLFLSCYFGVSIDFLLGRLPNEEAKQILKNYDGPRQESYNFADPPEDYEYGGSHEGWPYNFMSQVRAGGYLYKPLVTSYEVTDDILKGIDYALETLPEKFRNLILKRYKDGATPKEICEEYGFSFESVRRNLVTAFKMIEESRLKRMILYGYDFSTQENELTRRKELMALEASKIGEASSEKITEEHHDEVRAIDILEMRLSARAYNCLTRSGIRTVEQLIDYVDQPEGYTKLRKIRNLGEGTVNEIFLKLEELTGIDYRSL